MEFGQQQQQVPSQPFHQPQSQNVVAQIGGQSTKPKNTFVFGESIQFSQQEAPFEELKADFQMDGLTLHSSRTESQQHQPQPQPTSLFPNFGGGHNPNQPIYQPDFSMAQSHITHSVMLSESDYSMQKPAIPLMVHSDEQAQPTTTISPGKKNRTIPSTLLSSSLSNRSPLSSKNHRPSNKKHSSRKHHQNMETN